MNKFNLFAIVLGHLILTSFNIDDLSNWKLEKNKNGIKVYSYIPKGESLKHIKMSTIITARLSSVVSVLVDVGHYTDWIYNCSEARIVEKINPQEVIYYSISDAPWPIDNRDMVMHNRIYQDKKTQIVHSITTPSTNKIDKKNNLVRITKLDGKWRFTPLKDGNIFVEYYLKINPGGNLPDWVSNMFIAYGPYQSMLKFKEALLKEQHRNAEFDFIDEPQ